MYLLNVNENKMYITKCIVFAVLFYSIQIIKTALTFIIPFMTTSYYIKLRTNAYENQSIRRKQTNSKVRLDSYNNNSCIHNKLLMAPTN